MKKLILVVGIILGGVHFGGMLVEQGQNVVKQSATEYHQRLSSI